MALATGIMIQMPMLRTPNYKSTPIKPMTITCAQDRYRGKQGQKDRREAGKGRGPQINSILQSTTTSSRNLQLDNIYATNTLSDINDQDDQNTSPTSIGNIDYDYQI
ncbi:hypothetical protein QL285_081346 [Trifolium repens]|jgi:hypothetical protein|nr:hypothetical protein QL285_081346 [Trifolium repens]